MLPLLRLREVRREQHFFGFLVLIISPAGSTKAHPKIKLDSSPTPPVCVLKRLIRFLIRQTITPLNGPYANAAISAGSSEKSILIKLGINGTLKLRNIRTVETAAKNGCYSHFSDLKSRHYFFFSFLLFDMVSDLSHFC